MGAAVALYHGNFGILRWCLYIIVVCSYHLSEFLVTAKHHPEDVSFNSFLLFEQREYVIAILASWTEFWIEWLYFPQTKEGLVTLLAIAVVVSYAGQAIRSLAMHQAGVAFTHLIAAERRPEHKLVTSGLYSVLRHPGYFGWFWNAVGTQLLLLNPLCIIGYAIASWNFFATRIPYEEMTLSAMFPGAYEDYRQRTFIGIPFIGRQGLCGCGSRVMARFGRAGG